VVGRRCPRCLARIRDRSAAMDFPCGGCRRRPPAVERLLAGWFYDGAMRQSLRGLKFHRLEYLGDALGTSLWTRHREVISDCTAVVPVPLHWIRTVQRGYNQSELIAAEVARRLELPLTRALHRRRATAAQSGLDLSERRRNVRGAFTWRGRRTPVGGPWLLIDDVLTTGATLDSAARTLRRAGVTRVTGLVAALTPHPSETRPGTVLQE